MNKIAVLGSGIMGSSLALFLARQKRQIDMFEQTSIPFKGASRYNEGKIHLGYLYGADPTLKTAKKLIPGGLAFPRLLRELLQIDIDRFVTASDDLYLIHRQSVADSEQAIQVASQISQLVNEHPECNNYFIPLQNPAPRVLSGKYLENNYNTQKILSGYQVPERSIATQPIADAYVDALNATPGISIYCNHRVYRAFTKKSDQWYIETSEEGGTSTVHGPYKAVINALWEGREKVDQSVGLPSPISCSHRYRVSLFVKTKSPVNFSSAVVSVGPFGDIKNYDGRNLYLSWYNSGLQVEGEDIAPPPTPHLDPEHEKIIASESLENLGDLIPAVRQVANNIETLEVNGGWVYAAGRGPLNRIDSELHRRDRIGVRNKSNFISVDTGKIFYCTLASTQPG